MSVTVHLLPGDPPALHRLGASGEAAGAAVPELAIVLDRPLRGPGVTAAEALRAAGSVHAALVHLGPDGVPLAWTLGPAGRPAAQLDLALEAVLVEVDGTVADSAAGAAILGHPAEALAAAANLAADGLEAGCVVLTGPLTAPHEARTLAVHFTSLGSLFVPAPA